MSGVEVRRSERDGCQCPPYVTCAHFEGRRVWMIENARAFELHRDFKGHFFAYSLFGPTNEFRLEDCCGYEHVNVAAETLQTDSLPAAEAEFERRAEELRKAPVEECL